MRQDMLRDLAERLGGGDADKGLCEAMEYLKKYEGCVVCRLSAQYQRLRARQMYDRGLSYNDIAAELDVSARHVFNLLHR